MALRIRLARAGSKKRPFYRIVVADARSPRDGRFVERIGSYNPLLPGDHEDRIVLKKDRAEHWVSVGAQPSHRVAHFLATEGLIKKPEITEQTKKNQPKQKAQERLREEEERKKAALEAEKTATEEASEPAEA